MTLNFTTHEDPRVGPADIGNRFGVIADLEFVCRPHIAVLITDGGESNYYASEACLRNGTGVLHTWAFL